MFWEGCRKPEIGPEGQNTDFERRAGSGAAGDRKVNSFQLKIFRKASILYPGSLGTDSGRFRDDFAWPGLQIGGFRDDFAWPGLQIGGFGGLASKNKEMVVISLKIQLF